VGGSGEDDHKGRIQEYRETCIKASLEGQAQWESMFSMHGALGSITSPLHLHTHIPAYIHACLLTHTDIYTHTHTHTPLLEPALFETW
jgi:hypothetical protein